MGFIKIHRNIREWGWYDDANTLAVWVHLLIDANFEEKMWHGETVGVGSLITSTARLAEQTGLSVKQIRICIARLAEEGKIVTEGASKWTKITICNYESYMVDGEGAGQTKGEQRASKGQAEGEQRATPKEDKKTRRQEKKTSSDVKETLSFPFSSDEFMQTWAKLVKEPKWKPKTVSALQLSLNKLSRYDERFAIMLMEDAIEHGWQGVVFKDTDAQYAEWIAVNPPAKKPDAEPALPFSDSPWVPGVFYTVKDFQSTEEGRQLLESFKGGWQETILAEEGGLLRFMTLWEPLSDHPEFAEQNKDKLK